MPTSGQAAIEALMKGESQWRGVLAHAEATPTGGVWERLETALEGLPWWGDGESVSLTLEYLEALIFNSDYSNWAEFEGVVSEWLTGGAEVPHRGRLRGAFHESWDNEYNIKASLILYYPNRAPVRYKTHDLQELPEPPLTILRYLFEHRVADIDPEAPWYTSAQANIFHWPYLYSEEHVGEPTLAILGPRDPDTYNREKLWWTAEDLRERDLPVLWSDDVWIGGRFSDDMMDALGDYLDEQSGRAERIYPPLTAPLLVNSRVFLTWAEGGAGVPVVHAAFTEG